MTNFKYSAATAATEPYWGCGQGACLRTAHTLDNSIAEYNRAHQVYREECKPRRPVRKASKKRVSRNRRVSKKRVGRRKASRRKSSRRKSSRKRVSRGKVSRRKVSRRRVSRGKASRRKYKAAAQRSNCDDDANLDKIINERPWVRKLVKKGNMKFWRKWYGQNTSSGPRS